MKPGEQVPSEEQLTEFYRAIYELTNEAERKASEKPCATWNRNIGGINVVVERWGTFCYWESIRVKRKGQEVYRLDLVFGAEEGLGGPAKDAQGREESFFGRKKRAYAGNQFSFIEYLGIAAEQNS